MNFLIDEEFIDISQFPSKMAMPLLSHPINVIEYAGITRNFAERVLQPISLESESSVLSETRSDCTSGSHSVAAFFFNEENHTNTTAICADNCKGNNTTSCSTIKPPYDNSLAPPINPGLIMTDINGSCSINPPRNKPRTIYDPSLTARDEKSAWKCQTVEAIFEKSYEDEGEMANYLPVCLTAERIPCDVGWGLLGCTERHVEVSLESRRFGKTELT